MEKFDPNFHLVLEAASFAARKHQGQMRKDGQTPYFSHPFRVCLILREMFGMNDPRMLMTSILHDTIEDTTADYDDLAERFGPEVASWSAALSKDKRLPEERREEAYIDVLQKSPWQVHVCKLADIIDNLLDSTHFKREQQQRFLQRAEQYFRGLQQVASPEIQQALEITGEVLERSRDDLKQRS